MERNIIIDKYLNDQLTAEEKKEFDHLMASDTLFKNEVETAQLLADGIRLSHLSSKMKMLQSIERTEDIKPKNNIRTLNFKKLALAASFALMASISFWLVFQNSSNSLYDEYYQVIPATEIERAQANLEDNFIKGIELYNSMKYADALEYFELSKGPYPRASFYQGISQMELKQFKSAITSFKSYLNSNDSNPLPANYYIGLCYLQLNDHTQAKQYLSLVSEKEATFYSNAQELILLL